MSEAEDAEARILEAQALIEEAERLMGGARGWLRRLCQFSGLGYERIRLIRKGAHKPSTEEIGKLQSGLEKLRATLVG